MTALWRWRASPSPRRSFFCARQQTASLLVIYEPWDATDRAVTWRSSDSKVAAVDENGLVTAVANGTAVITAEAGGKTASCTVDVADRNVWVEKGGHTYYIGEDGQFVTDYQEIEGSLYIFDGEGRLQKGAITHEGQRFFAARTARCMYRPLPKARRALPITAKTALR